MELRDALSQRRMVRNFTDEPIAEPARDRILHAARRAPAAGNSQALDLVVLVGPDETARYWDATLPPDRRAGFRWPGLLRAPMLVIGCVAPDAYVARYAEPDKVRSGLGAGAERWTVPYWHIDGGMAAMAMLLTVVDEGLGALFFGIFDHEDAVRAALDIPDEVMLIGTIAVGHPAPDEPGRSAARPRRSATEVVHRGGW